MSGLAGAGHGALELLLTALAHGTVLAVLGAIVAATLLRRARPAVLAAMWTVVLLKFLVPFGPGARFSLASLAARARAPEPAAALVVVVDPSAARAAAPAAPRAPSPWPLAIAGAWLGLAGLVAARQLGRYRRARRQAQAAAPAPAWLAAEVDALAGRIGRRRRRRRLDVRIADDDVAPYLIGAVAPIVVVPAGLLAPHRRAVREAALLHELAHVRRADAALRIVQAIAGSLFWFWPVVRWVNRRIDHARELACDAYAIAHGPLAAPAYARMLVEVVRARGAAPAGGLALARRAQLGRRIDRLIARPVAAGLGLPGVLAVGAWAAVGLTGAGRAAAAPPHTTVCLFSPEIASAILQAHPTADLDGDGAISRTEACDFQQALRRRAVDAALAGQAGAYDASYDTDGDGALGLAEESARRDALASVLPVSLLPDRTPLASEQLCCDCAPPGDAGVSTLSPTARAAIEPIPAMSTCVRGVEP